MISRRQFIHTAMLFSGGLLMACPESSGTQASSGNTADQNTWFMPDEGETHKRTWMAFGASETIWGTTLLPEVRRNLATIARTIAKYEPVSMLVRENEYDLARGLVGPDVELIVANMDDLWMRDTGPVFVISKRGAKAGIDFHFNGWGQKQAFAQDSKIATIISKQAKVSVLKTSLVLEGGGIEVDGQGTAIISESCVLNSNRNPGLSKPECEAELKRLLGLQKIIWLPGIKGKDITDGHTDFYARFARPGVVVAGYDPDPASFDHAVTTAHLGILKAATDARGQKLEVIVLEGPTTIRKAFETAEFAAGYIGFFVCNGAVIMQEFGDAQADQTAKKALQRAFPDREVVQINIDGIAAGGGSIHCTTQQEPMV
jgi:agmatine deiminase